MFTLKNKSSKKEVEIKGVSLEEYIDGDKPVVSVFIETKEGKEIVKSTLHFDRDPSAAIGDFESLENDEYSLTQKADK